MFTFTGDDQLAKIVVAPARRGYCLKTINFGRNEVMP